MLSLEDSIARGALAELGITLKETKEDVVRLIGEGDEPSPKRRRGPRMPFTPRAKKVLELSLRIARKEKVDYIGAEHVLLALFDETEGVASQILRERGVKEKELRRCIEALRGEI